VVQTLVIARCFVTRTDSSKQRSTNYKTEGRKFESSWLRLQYLFAMSHARWLHPHWSRPRICRDRGGYSFVSSRLTLKQLAHLALPADGQRPEKLT
jgi:hypothetical protein